MLGELLNDVSLLPDKFALVLIYAGVGCVGGVIAGCGRFASALPSLSEIILRSIVGGGTGFIVGAGCMAKFGDTDTAVWSSMAICGVSGFIGPTAVWELWKSRSGAKANGDK